MRRQTTAQPTWCSWDDDFHLSWQGAAGLTCCSWADNWVDKLQLSLHIAAELTYCSWAKVSQLGWQTELKTAANLTYHDWADRLHPRWQIAKELALPSWCLAAGLSQQMNCMTEYARADRLLLSWQNAAELTDCSWTHIMQAELQRSWHCAEVLTTEGRAPELTVWGWLGMWQPSWQNAAQLTSCSQGQQIAKSTKKDQVQLSNFTWAERPKLGLQSSGILYVCSWTHWLLAGCVKLRWQCAADSVRLTDCRRADSLQLSRAV